MTKNKPNKGNKKHPIYLFNFRRAWHILSTWSRCYKFKANFGLEIENLEVRNLVLQERPLYDRIKLHEEMDAQWMYMKSTQIRIAVT